jgi:pimeloyl-ACP methyl ester carboxylesterase
MDLPARVAAWRDRGRDEEVGGHRIHVFEHEGSEPLLIFLHGFPSSSYDWRALLDLETEHAVLAPDFLGFGLSEKPRDHDYTLHWQADMLEELVRRRGHPKPVFIVAHDMGTSVATELMARDLEGALEMKVSGALLLNGSMIQDAASPTLGQRLLRSAVGPLFLPALERALLPPAVRLHLLAGPSAHRRGSEGSVGLSSALGRSHHRAQDDSLKHEERFRHAERWHGALTGLAQAISLAWGMLDPVATERVLDAVLELRPAATLTRYDDLGHYPQIEDPGRVADALRQALNA